MSTKIDNIPASAAELYGGGPYIGALLRITYNVTRQRSEQVVQEWGLSEVNKALLNGFLWPPGQGVRPVDLAAKANMTRQAANKMIGELERLGYMERRAAKPGGRRLVFLTRRGWKVYEAIWTAQKRLQEEWTTILGKERFEEFMSTLRLLSMVNTNSSSTNALLPVRPERKAGAGSRTSGRR